MRRRVRMTAIGSMRTPSNVASGGATHYDRTAATARIPGLLDPCRRRCVYPDAAQRHVPESLLMPDNGRGGLDGFAHNLVTRVVMYYAGLAALIGAAWAIIPAPVLAEIMTALSPLIAFRDGTPAGLKVDTSGGPFVNVVAPSAEPLILIVVAVLTAFLLALPVAWVYMFTRQRKGYRASDVQALVLMPVVVAGVVVLVKNSVALAFSLAGIVAAVRFRTTLEDSRDAP